MTMLDLKRCFTLGYSEADPPEFVSGQVYENSHSLTEQAAKCNDVLKFGCISEYTRGKISCIGSIVCINCPEQNQKFVFHNQIEVDCTSDQPFGEPGDSGSLVLAPHNQNRSDLRAVGIFIAKSLQNSYIVTPIWAILEVLCRSPSDGLKKLQVFPLPSAGHVADSQFAKVFKRMDESDRLNEKHHTEAMSIHQNIRKNQSEATEQANSKMEKILRGLDDTKKMMEQMSEELKILGSKQ